MTILSKPGDAQILLRSRVDFTRMTGPTIAECWLLDAANYLGSSPAFDGHQRASVLWPDLVAVPARELTHV